MENFSNLIIKNKKLIVAATILLLLISTIAFINVPINYNMTDYLPAQANSTIALNTLEDEFGDAVPNANMMFENVSIEQALAIKSELEGIQGISSVDWLDDAVDLNIPLQVQDQDTINNYYKDQNALFSVTIDSGMERSVTDNVTALYGDQVSMSGSAVEQADSQRLASSQTIKSIFILGPMIILILILATTSWIEPFIYLTTIGAAVIINLGSQIFMGEISYITLAVAPILQMAVSLDYAVFLSSSFEKHRLTSNTDTIAMKKAMKESLKTIMASALTTVFGFLALTLMNFKIGPDMGIALVKGVILSFIACLTFLPAAILLLQRFIDKTKHRRLMPNFKKLSKGAVKSRVPVFLLVAFIGIFAFLGQSNNQFIYGTGDAAGNTPGVQKIESEFGKNNVMVVLVPNTSMVKEALLSEDIKAMPYVSDVISYTTEIGQTIPANYLPADITDNFISENYSRIIVYSDLPDKSAEAFTLVQNIRNTAADYYGDEVLTCGQSANLYDMKNTVEQDNKIVNLVTLLAIFLILALTFKSWFLPLLMILTIKVSIWINMAIPFYTGSSLIYIGYLVVSAIQMGATIDYAILLTENYLEERTHNGPLEAMVKTLETVIPSVLVSALVLAFAGFSLALVSSNEMVAAMGILIGRGAILPLLLVNLFLPALLIFTDKIIPHTIWGRKKKEILTWPKTAVVLNKEKSAPPVYGLFDDYEEVYDDIDDSIKWKNGGLNYETK